MHDGDVIDFPAQRTVLFSGPVNTRDGRPSIAESIYFKTSAGAKVFHTGTLAWPLALAKDDEPARRFQQLNANILQHLLEK